MTTAIKRRRGTTTQHSTFTGLEGEITIDTTKDTAVVHDGATAGGRPLLREDLANNTEVVTKTGTQTLTNKTLTSPVINTPTGITKSDISLGNVDNTSDATKNAATATLTNKTITLGANTITGTVAQFQAAVTDGDFATLAGTETLTNKAFNGSLGATTPSTVSATSVTVNGGTFGAATFTTNSVDGLAIGGKTGSTSDFSLYNPAGSIQLLRNPTGTGNLVFGGNVGIGTASPTQKLEVNGAALVSSSTGFVRIATTSTPTSGTAALQISINSVNARTIRMENTLASGHTYDIINGAVSAGNLGIFDDTAGAYRMIIDANGNVGVGTTPSAWGSNFKVIESTGGSSAVYAANNINGLRLTSNLYNDNTNFIYKTTGGAAFYSINTSIHQWFNAPSGTAGTTATLTQAMTLNASGNLGLGVTPSAWNTATKNIQNPAGSIYSVGTTDTGIVQNAFLDSTGTWKYVNTAAASYFAQTGGAFSWASVTSGTAGATAGLTNKMTLDASGNLGIGTASPDVRLQVSSASLAAIKASITSSAGNVARLQLTGGTADYAWYVTDNANYTALYDYNAGAERMRIDSSGNLLVGTTSTSNSAKVSIVGGSLALNQNSVGNAASIIRRYNNVGSNGIQIQGNSADTINDTNPGASILVGGGPLTDTYEGNIVLTAYGNTAGGTRNNITFQTRSGVNTVTERARIDSSGNLLVNTTSVISAGKLNIAFPSGTNGIDLKFTNASNNGSFIGFFNSTGGLAGVVSQTGATTVAYTTSSDYRLKENIAPMTGALATVQALKPVTYNWKEDGSNGQGFIAHELQSVIPDCVVGEKDATREEQYEISPAIPAVLDEEDNEVTPAVEAVMGTRTVPVYQGIDTSFLVATLAAAIQELKAELDITKAKVAALEAA